MQACRSSRSSLTVREIPIGNGENMLCDVSSHCALYVETPPCRNGRRCVSPRNTYNTKFGLVALCLTGHDVTAYEKSCVSCQRAKIHRPRRITATCLTECIKNIVIHSSVCVSKGRTYRTGDSEHAIIHHTALSALEISRQGPIP